MLPDQIIEATQRIASELEQAKHDFGGATEAYKRAELIAIESLSVATEAVMLAVRRSAIVGSFRSKAPELLKKLKKLHRLHDETVRKQRTSN